MKQTLPLLSSLALLVACASANAQPQAVNAAPIVASANAGATVGARRGGGHDKADFLQSYDANGDSIVARAEFDARRGEHYHRADANRDGVVTEAEYVAEYQVRLEADLADMRERQLRQAHVRFGVLDTDHNAGMSATEFGASGERMFSRLDTNADGAVDERDSAENY